MLNRLEMMRIFCVTAESASFKAAASRLGVSPQVVTRAIKELETLLGEPLFYRNTRQMRITGFGADLALRARNSLHTVDALFMPADARPESEISGAVRITAPVMIGRKFLLPMVRALSQKHPHLRLDLRLADTHTNVIDQQIDIGVRVGFLRDSSFIARPASKVAFYIVATPTLAKDYTTPRHPQDLNHLPVTSLVDNRTGRLWPWHLTNGHQFIPHNPAFQTDDSETELQAALQGIAFAQLAGCIAIPYIRAGVLVTVLDDYMAPPWEVYVYRPQRGPVPSRIRLVYDRIIDTLSDADNFPVTL